MSHFTPLAPPLPTGTRETTYCQLPQGSATALTLARLADDAPLLVVTPDDVFRGLVPWLLAAATLLFAAGDRIARALTRMGAGGPAQMVAGLFLVSAYGGYFNGGVGILLLALFTVMGIADLNAANALKNLMSVVLTTIAVAAYAAAGVVAWQPAAVMAVAADDNTRPRRRRYCSRRCCTRRRRRPWRAPCTSTCSCRAPG